MPTCDYCGETFADEESHLDHLADAHEGDLGRIDQRRVDDHRGGDAEGINVTRAAAIAGIVTGLFLAVGAFVMFTGGGGGQTSTASQAAPTPHDLGDVHYHGSLEVVVNGQQVDFSKDKYQLQERFFHFEGGNGIEWHGHARGVTLKRAMATLDIGVTKNSVTFNGTTYTDGENANVTIVVNDEPVNPRTYVLQDSDNIRIVVESN